ncbi:MAG: alpha/beta hydrolase, partial [Gammaproteobacteria bacterium]|nr:alpha/beta hydrolase [Gammaproteobacteria bacterium]
MAAAVVTEHRLERGDATLYITEQGAGSPLLLLHGWSLDGRMFAPQVAAFAQHFRVLTLDRRGFGRSTGRPDLGREVDDVGAVLAELAGEPAHLLGMSQGGRVALRFAAGNAAKLRSLVLQGAAVDGADIPESPEERIPVERYANLARQGKLQALRELWCAHSLMRLADESPATQRLIHAILADYRGQDLLNAGTGNAAAPTEVVSRLAGIEVPTLLINGANETEARKGHAA